MLGPRKLLYRLLPLPLLLAYFAIPTLTNAQAEQGSIVGQIRISPGSLPSHPIMVTIETRGAVVNSAYSDNEGRFGINGLPGNIYHVVINEDEYEPIRETVNLNPGVNPLQILTIFLVPRPTDKKSSEASASGGNPNLVDLSEYTKKAPPKARKEFDAGVKADQQNKVDDAIKHYQNAIAIAPDFYPARNNLGSALLGKKDYPSAQQQFEAAVKINPSDASAYFNLGNLFLLSKQYDQGKSWVERGLSRQPDSAFGHFIQGSLFTVTGQFKEAELALRRCLELDPIMAKAHLALVNVYLREQRKEEAVAELKAFVKGFPGDPQADHARELLQRLGSTDNSAR